MNERDYLSYRERVVSEWPMSLWRTAVLEAIKSRREALERQTKL